MVVIGPEAIDPGGKPVTMKFIQRECKFDIFVLFYTLSLGFAARSDRSILAFLERYVEMADYTDVCIGHGESDNI